MSAIITSGYINSRTFLRPVFAVCLGIALPSLISAQALGMGQAQAGKKEKHTEEVDQEKTRDSYQEAYAQEEELKDTRYSTFLYWGASIVLVVAATPLFSYFLRCSKVKERNFSLLLLLLAGLLAGAALFTQRAEIRAVEYHNRKLGMRRKAHRA